MNIFNKVTLRSLRKNKTRTLVTIIGIILSTSLICAVSTSVSSFMDYMKRCVIYDQGNWHGSDDSADAAKVKDVMNSDEIDEITAARQIGYAEIGSENTSKPYLYVLGTDNKFNDLMPVHLTSGRLPANENEILLPDHLFTNGGVKYSAGDTLELDIGDRIRDDFILGQSNPYYSPSESNYYDSESEDEDEVERFEIREHRSYTVVGTYERPGFEDWFAPGYTALTVSKENELQDDAVYELYFSIKKPKDLYKFTEKHNINGSTNYQLLACMGISRYSDITNMLYSVAAIIIILIIFGSVSLIYNAFAISVSERTKQFGLLSSVGATKKQLRRTVFFEAGTVSLLGIPAGILLGIAGIGVTLSFISEKFASIVGMSSGNVKMKLCISVTSIAIAIVVALATVLISAWIPSKRATKISAVEAIRQNKDIKDRKKPIRTPKFIGKLFGLPGILAHKYYKRSKKKYRATVVSLFMSIVLFIPSSAFTGYLMGFAGNIFYTNGYDISYNPYDHNAEDFDRDAVLNTLSNIESTDHVAYSMRYSNIGNIDSEYLTNDGKKYYSDYETAVMDLYFVNDEEFLLLLDEYKLDKDQFLNPDEPVCLGVDTTVAFDPQKEKMVTVDFVKNDKCRGTFKIRRKIEGYDYRSTDYNTDPETGEEVITHHYTNIDDPDNYIDIPDEDAYIDINIKCEKILDKRPFFAAGTSSLTFIYPYSAIDKLRTDSEIYDSDPEFGHAVVEHKDGVVSMKNDTYYHGNLGYKIIAEDHKSCYASIKDLTNNRILPNGDISDYAEMAESDRNMVTIIKVFSYGFIILISLIAAANVFNTISTNINLRRREFAMLKSIGMTGRDFTKMMNFECILYGAKSLIYGLPVSIGVTYLIYKAVNNGYETVFHLPWKAIAIAVSSVMIVVFATMMYSMHKVRKDNPVDTLKNENI